MRGLFSGLTEKQRILKNFIAFNLSFLFLFASFDDVALVAGILNQDQGLGNTSQAIIYVFQLISSFVWPQLLIQLLGFKISLAIGQVAFFLFFLANVFPSWATLIPTSILTGLANSLTWTILGIYFTLLSKKYSRLENVPFLNVQTMFFGWFGCIFFFNYLLGASWLGGILQLKDLPMNSTYDYSENCGANNYPQTKLPESASKPSIKSVYILGGTLVASSAVALLITLFFVDDILDDDEEGKPIKRSKVTFSLIKHEFVEEFKNLARLSKNLDIWLLLPITFYLGYELTIIWYEFNRAFVSCLKNVNYIGWCSIVYGVVASIFSYLVGKLAKHIGLQTTIVMMLLVGLSNCIFMLSWTPRYDQGYVVFLMAATFGFTNSLATAQVRAIFGVFFPKDPTAYSGAILFETMGLILGSVLSIFFQARIKIYVYIAVIFLGVISYVWLEVRHRHRAMIKSEKEHFAAVNYANENDNEVEKVDKEIFGTENPNYDYIPTNGEKESVEI